MKRFTTIRVSNQRDFVLQLEDAIEAGWELVSSHYVICESAQFWAALLVREEGPAT